MGPRFKGLRKVNDGSSGELVPDMTQSSGQSGSWMPLCVTKKPCRVTVYASVPRDNFVPVATSSNCLVGGADTNRL